MIRRMVLVAALAALSLAAATPAAAQGFDNDVRLRAGFYWPEDLPTDPAPILSLEFRNLLTARDGIVWGVGWYADEHEQIEKLQFLGTPTEFTLKADITMVPVYAGWYHLWTRDKANWFAGVTVGFYLVDAFSGGYSGAAQISDVGDFRFLEDDTLFGGQIFAGVDFIPGGRWGWSIEGRLHLVEDDYSGGELAVSGLWRF